MINTSVARQKLGGDNGGDRGVTYQMEAWITVIAAVEYFKLILKIAGRCNIVAGVYEKTKIK